MTWDLIDEIFVQRMIIIIQLKYIYNLNEIDRQYTRLDINVCVPKILYRGNPYSI